MKKPIIFSFISFLIAAIILIVLVWPGYKELREKQIDIQSKQTDLRNLEKYITRLQEISDMIAASSADLSKIDSALPKSSNLANLLGFVEKSASENGLILESAEIFPTVLAKDFQAPENKNKNLTQKKEGIQETSLGLKLSGSYSSFKTFLSDLEKSARLIEVTSISFSSKTPGKPSTANLKIKVYSY